VTLKAAVTHLHRAMHSCLQNGCTFESKPYGKKIGGRNLHVFVTTKSTLVSQQVPEESACLFLISYFCRD